MLWWQHLYKIINLEGFMEIDLRDSYEASGRIVKGLVVTAGAAVLIGAAAYFSFREGCVRSPIDEGQTRPFEERKNNFDDRPFNPEVFYA